MKGNESNGSTLLLGDNKSVVLNYIMHSSFLKKRPLYVPFREAFVSDIITVIYITHDTN